MSICPYCKFDESPFLVNGKLGYGTPIRKCKRCHNTYYDEGFQELYLIDDELGETLEKAQFHFPTIVGIACALFFLLSMYFIWTHSIRTAVLLWAAICVLVVIQMEKSKKCTELVEWVKEEYQRSQERCQRPEYLQQLAINGYPFSLRFLRDNSEFWRWLSYYKNAVVNGDIPVDYAPGRGNNEWDIIEGKNVERAKQRQATIDAVNKTDRNQ